MPLLAGPVSALCRRRPPINHIGGPPPPCII